MSAGPYPLQSERLLGQAVRSVATELRLVDLVDLIKLVQSDDLAALHDLVSSSTELYFQRGTLEFALSASLAISWTAAPVVAIDLEFRHLDIHAIFRLELRSEAATIRLLGGALSQSGPDIEQLSLAVDSARSGCIDHVGLRGLDPSRSASGKRRSGK